MKSLLLVISLCSVLVVTLDNGLGLTPPMGWNSWNHFACDIHEQLIKETADQMISTGLAAKGYNYINLDDCWQVKRDTSGKIVADPKAFPSGIKSLADYMHSKGLKLGVYSDAGYYTCAGRPGSLGHEQIDAQTYAEWGVDYLKYDNCNTDKSSPKIRYPIMRDALNKTGRPIFFSMCEWGVEDPASWAREVGNSWRTTGDIRDEWGSFTDILDKNEGLYRHAGPGGWNDPDMLEVGNGGMTFNEYQAHFALWALMKSPLLIGCDLGKIEQKYIDLLGNTDLIAVNQDRLGQQGKRVRSIGNGILKTEIWKVDVAGGVVGLYFNRGEVRQNIEITFAELGVRKAKASVRDLMAQKDLGEFTEKYSAQVDRHSAVVFKVFA